MFSCLYSFSIYLSGSCFSIILGRIQEVMERHIRQTDRQTDRCTGEPLSFSCPKDSEGPLQWRWNDASFPAGGGRADPGPGFHPSVGCSVWSCQPFHGQAVKTPQLRHLLTHINSSHSTEQYSRSVFWIPGDVCPGRSHGCLGIMSKAVLSPTCVLSSLAKL